MYITNLEKYCRVTDLNNWAIAINNMKYAMAKDNIS